MAMAMFTSWVISDVASVVVNDGVSSTSVSAVVWRTTGNPLTVPDAIYVASGIP
ncbi:MAG: hypothetical protein R3D80_21480 [Paracoccaceae bacterium]